MTVSEKARGKKRALEQDDVDASMDLDLDDSGLSDTELVDAGTNGRVDGQRTPSRGSGRSSKASTPSTSASASTAATGTDYELGGSISRAARMRATTTEDEGGSGSESASGDSDVSESHRLALNTPSKSAKRSKGFVTASSGEAYLRAMSRPAKTSNKKLSDSWYSSNSPFTQTTLLAALQSANAAPKARAAEEKIRKLESVYAALHDQWDFELEQGFSVFLYGLGSKSQIVQDFMNLHLRKKRRKSKALVVNGFLASMGIDEVISAFEDVVLGPLIEAEELAHLKMGRSAAKLNERARNVVQTMSERTDLCIYLLVNNIDGIAFRPFRAQAILSYLASQKQVRLLASIDHVKAPLLFPSSLATARGGPAAHDEKEGEAGLASGATGYNILYHHTPTFRSYTTEAVHSGTLASLPPTLFASDKSSALGGGLHGQSSEARAKAAFFVLASLTQKSKDVFMLLAERQIAAASEEGGKKRPTSMNKEKAPPHATPYASLFSIARDRFLANNVNQFEALLREYRDHDVMLSSNTPPEDAADELDGEDVDREEVGQRSNEWIWIAIEKEELAELLERIRSGT